MDHKSSQASAYTSLKCDNNKTNRLQRKRRAVSGVENEIPSEKKKKCPYVVDLSLDKMKNLGKDVVNEAFKEKLKQYSSCTVHYYTDGSRTDIGGVRVGCAVTTEKAVIASRRLRNSLTSTDSEYCALIMAGNIIKTDTNNTDFLVVSDAKGALQPLYNAYTRRRKKYSKIALATANQYELLSLSKNITFLFVPSHLDIPGNETADKAAKEASFSDCSPCICLQAKCTCNVEWGCLVV